ncbi:TetR/AcrR family transcriptional regulator [Gordonia zhaorongruii]|uniref:TetR/AcrR family transcriptional regulator n=1 Tax=Gordonia zhaorongruii TaxID=2597659 RepID=UPI00117DAE12|nr:TetR/AcrR family transcriptional regulator [Gordonia zhaorongruii]
MSTADDSGDWVGSTRRSAARDRILATAGEVFASRGADASMSDIAEAVGCSRATLYRYFDSRTRLQLAYIAAVTRSVSATVRERTDHLTDPAVRLTESVVLALAAVREDPALSAWFAPRGAGLTSELALSSDTIETVARRFLSADSESAAVGARWLIRMIVSFLVVPAGPDSEREMIRLFVTPPLLASVGMDDRTTG